MPTEKTWTQVVAQLDDTYRKWPACTYTLESVFVGARAPVRRRAGRPGQTLEERTVSLSMVWRDSSTFPAVARQMRLSVTREETALANLEVLAKAVEWIRMAHVRGVHSPIVKMLRQLYPEPRPAPPPPPPPRERVRPAGPYDVLHVAGDAPLEVAEAAYRALVKAAHPDAGGHHTTMVALNAAIERIRAAHAHT